MRKSLIALLLLTSSAWAVEPKPEDFTPVFELAGISLLCEQSAPMVQHDLSDELQAGVVSVFSAQAFCQDLASRLAKTVDQAQLQEAQRLLGGELAREFSAAEREVGESLDELSTYRTKLGLQAPRAERVALVRRLDNAARTTELATLLRYEAGKTRAFLTMKAGGATVEESALSERTRAQEAELRASSVESVESFMLFAYRRKPSDQLTQYAELYEQPAVAAILRGTVELLPQLFAERRAKL